MLALLSVNWFALAAASQYANDLLFLPSEAALTDRVVIVALDDVALERVGPWPWSRGVFAEAVEKISADGARVIGIDVMFTRPNDSDPQGDRRLAEALRGAGNVVLASGGAFERASLSQGLEQPDRLDLPMPEFASAARAVAHVNVYNPDGVVREVPLLMRWKGDLSLGFSAALISEYLGSPAYGFTYRPGDALLVGGVRIPLGRRGEVMVNYTTLPGGFPRVSLADVLDGSVPEGLFRGCMVLIAPWSRTFKDSFATPVGEMLGIEIHANVIQSILTGLTLARVDPWYSGLLILLLCLANGVLFIHLRIWLGGLLALLQTLGVALLWALSLELGALASWLGVDGVAGLVSDLAFPLFAVWLCFGAIGGVRYYQSYRAERRGRQLFGRFVSRQVLQEIMSSDDGALRNPRGQQREISVLFADIRGYTSLSERMGAERIFNLLNEYLAVITRAIFKHEGTLNKFLGDAVLAIYNAPIPQPDHALRAVRTAVEMQQALASVNLTGVEPGDVACGIGVNTGSAMVGTIGTEERMEYTCIGDAVNVASRLQSFAEKGQVLISAATYEQVKEWVEVRALEPVRLKGKAEPMQVFQVLEVRSGPGGRTGSVRRNEQIPPVH